MKRLLFIALTALLINNSLFAQSPEGKTFGFGIVLGEPTGVTLKFWTQRSNAFVLDIGASYFGSPRIGLDYLWHFDAFNSSQVKLYAGPGVVIGIGQGNGFWYKEKHGFYYRAGSEIGLGARGVFGVNFVPRSSPLEMFFELAAMVGITPVSGSAFDAAIGIRYYP